MNDMLAAAGPGPSASATLSSGTYSSAAAYASHSNTLDTLTIPIVFGVIGAGLTLATIVIGIIQIRDMRGRRRAEMAQDDLELDEQPAPTPDAAATPPS